MRPTTVAAGAVVVALSGVGVATDRALPGDLLYGLKRGAEQVRVDLMTSPIAQAKARLDLARTRSRELQDVLAGSDGRTDAVVLPRVQDVLRSWSAQATRGGGVLLAQAQHGRRQAAAALLAFTHNQAPELSELLPKLPDGSRALASTAITYLAEVDADLSELPPS